MIDRGETAEALSILQDAVRAQPGYAAAYVLMARSLEAEGRYEEAVAAWRLVRVLVPDSGTAVEGIQRALRQRLLRASLEVITVVAEGLDLVPGPSSAAAPQAPSVEPPSGPGADGAENPDVPAASGPPDPAPSDDTPAPPVSAAADEEFPGNLDELIRELETARIVPDPTIRPAEIDAIEPDVDDVVSETLARIYANQRHFDEAVRVYEKLALQQPARAAEFRERAAELRARMGS